MSSQYITLLLWENTNEAESSTILHQKMQSSLFQNSSFSKIEQVESGTVKIWGEQDLTDS